MATILLLPCFSYANESSGLIKPNRNFVLSEQEAQFIQSIAPLRVMIDDNFVPLSSYDAKTHTFQGISVDLFRHLADRLGLKHQFLHVKSLSWSDKVELFKKKQVDLLMPVSFTEERATVGIFTSSFYDTYYGAIARKSRNIRIKDTNDLAAYKVGVTKSSAIIPFIRSIVPAARIISYDNQNDLYQGVMNGQIDIALQNKNVFKDDRFNLGFVELTLIHTIVESPRRYSFYLNKSEQYQRLAAIMDRYLAGIDSSRLLAHYEMSEDELVLRYAEQKHQKKMLVFGIIGSLALLALLGIAYLNHRRFTAKLAASLEQVQRQQEKLQKSEAHYRLLTENVSDVVWKIDCEYCFTYVSPADERLRGYKADEVIGRNVFELMTDEGIAPIREMARQRREAEQRGIQTGTETFEVQQRCSDGRWIWTEISSTPERDAHGTITGYHGITRDITGRKQADMALRASEERYQAIVSAFEGKIYICSQDYIITFMNAELIERTGRNAVGEHCFSALHDLDAICPWCVNERVFKGEIVRWEVQSPKDNHWYYVVNSPIINPDGTVSKQAMIQDITDRKLGEESLRSSQQQLSTLIETLPDAVFLKDGEGRWLIVNRVGLELFGLTGLPWQGKTGHELMLVQPAAAEALRTGLNSDEQVWQSGVAQHSEENIPAEDDQWRIFEVTKVPLFGADGSRKVLVVVGRDVSGRKRAEEERRQLEQQFYHAQKLESLGVLAGGIAHDFNNILTVILGHCYLAREETSSEQDYLTFFQQIEMAANRAADLCRQMLTYAGKSQLVKTRVNLQLLVDEVAKMLQSAINKNVAIELYLERDAIDIKGDDAQIQQIVMNLIINAAEAIGDKNGTIRIVLTKIDVEDEPAETDTFGSAIRAGSYACLEVTDTGSGMDEETQKRIFEPFYTTKFTGRGLGMSAIRGIVTAHEGTLQLTSTPGAGTTFKVCFPLAETFADVFHTALEPAPAEKAGGTVLLVEDEQTLLVMGATLLETLGFSPLTAQHGREALEIYQERSGEIDVILMDLIMPVMGGIEAYHELRKVAPTLPIIICSGYGAESATDVINEDKYARFVHKPYNPERLRDLMLTMIG